jgi:hypothetical protein
MGWNMKKQGILIKIVILLIVIVSNTTYSHAQNWSPQTKIKALGSWSNWFGVIVEDSTAAATGCAGNGVKAIDMSTMTPAKKAQIALLMMAYTKKQKVALYFEKCVPGNVNVITNVQVVTP